MSRNLYRNKPNPNSHVKTSKVSASTNPTKSTLKVPTEKKISYTEILKTVFDKLDVNSDGYITLEDLTNFKILNTLSNLTNLNTDTDAGEIDLTGFEKKIRVKDLDVAQLLANFKEGFQLCKNFVNLFQTKLNKINEAYAKFLNEIDYTIIFLTCLIVDNNGNEKVFTLPIPKSQEKVLMEELNFEFNLKDHFVSLFVNEDLEYTKVLEINGKKITLEISIETDDNISEADKEKLQKIKFNLISCHNKIEVATTELNNYKAILEGINSNTNPNNYLSFLKFLNKVLLLSSSDEELDNSVINSNDNSFVLNKSVSKNLFRSSILNKREELSKKYASENDRSFINSNRSFYKINTGNTANLLSSLGLGMNSKTEYFEQVIEEPATLVDERFKKIILKQATNETMNKSKQGSLVALLRFALNTNVVLMHENKFNVCKEYLKIIHS